MFKELIQAFKGQFLTSDMIVESIKNSILEDVFNVDAVAANQNEPELAASADSPGVA